MKVTIKKKEVTLEDDSGGILVMTLDQLIEMVRVLNAATNQDGGFFFEFLVFTV